MDTAVFSVSLCSSTHLVDLENPAKTHMMSQAREHCSVLAWAKTARAAELFSQCNKRYKGIWGYCTVAVLTCFVALSVNTSVLCSLALKDTLHPLLCQNKKSRAAWGGCEGEPPSTYLLVNIITERTESYTSLWEGVAPRGLIAPAWSANFAGAPSKRTGVHYTLELDLHDYYLSSCTTIVFSKKIRAPGGRW